MQEPFPYFPHETVRAGQDALLKDIDAALASQKILLAHAPTGLGKTAAALSVALQHAIEKKKKVLFLTNRHTQHLIAIETIKLIEQKTGEKIPCTDLIGKRWMCSQEVAGLYGNEFNEFCKAIVEKGECEFYSNVRSDKGLQVAAKKLLGDLREKGALHNQEVVDISRDQHMCSYEIALAMAKRARIIIGDYYYLFNPQVQNAFFTKLEWNMEDIIVIVDEAHNLPSRIAEMLSTNLTSFMLRNAILEARKFNYEGLIPWLQELENIVTSLAAFEDRKEMGSTKEWGSTGERGSTKEWGGTKESGSTKERGSTKEHEKLITREQLNSLLSKTVDYEHFINELETAADEVRKKQRKSSLGGIANFLDAWNGNDEGFTRIIAEKTGKAGPYLCLSYICLDPSLITKKIFSSIHSGVLMSGTLKPTFMYRDLLGIDNAVEREYSSPFPAENKLSIIVPETTTKYALRGEAMYRKIAGKCAEIGALIPGNVAFFFPSYQLRDRISDYFIHSRGNYSQAGNYSENSVAQSSATNHFIVQKKLFWEKPDWSKEEKEVFLAEFKDANKTGGILLGVTGGSFAEGIDYPGDLLQGVVVVGLPLARPSLHTKALIQYYDAKFGRGWDYGYIYPAINKCLQSSGRCIRSETDKGAVLFMDERLAWQRYFCCFPREGLIVSREYGKLLKEFYGRNGG